MFEVEQRTVGAAVLLRLARVERATGWTKETSSPVVQCVAVPANSASINVRIILQSTTTTIHSACSSVCLQEVVCNTYYYTTTTSTITSTHLLDPRSLSHHRHVLYPFLSSYYSQPCVVQTTTIRHAGASAPASDCDERRPPDHTLQQLPDAQEEPCRHSTTAASLLLLSTISYTASFFIFHHPYTLHCERGWLAAPPPQPWTPTHPSPDAPSTSDMKSNALSAQSSSAVSAVQRT